MTPTFCFLDESGTLNVANQDVRYFAVGAIIDSYPDELIERLHQEFEQLASVLKKDPSRLEFKFTSVTVRSLPCYLRCIRLLSQYSSWRFCSLIIDLDDGKFIPPKTASEAWECYLRYTKMMLQKNLNASEEAVLVADYLRQPKKVPVHSLATLPAVVAQLRDVLQVESQGVFLVQMADVLLGGSLYQGTDSVKLELANEIQKLRNQIGRARFNEWRVRWR